MDKRKALLIITIVIAVVLAALAVFYFFFRKDSVPTPPDSVFPVGPDIPIDNNIPPVTPTDTENYENRPQTFEQKLRVISTLPVSGAVLFDKNTETLIRYVERQKGNVFEASASKNTAPYRISNTTIPKIYEAFWTQNGEGVVLRYIKDGDIQTYYASIKSNATSTGEQALADGTYLPNNISSLVVSPAKDKIFYLSENEEGTTGIRANPNGTGRQELFSSTAGEWLITWPRAGTLSFVTKPSAGIPGLLYFLDANSRSFKKVFGGINGLTVLPNNDTSAVLFSESGKSRFELKLLSVAERKIVGIGITTLPEKCVWSVLEKEVLYCAVPDSIQGGAYPDIWYQGKVSFADNIWRIDTRTGLNKIILSPQAVAKTTMDITELSLSKDEKYLLFTNKKDLSLWLLTLDAPTP